MFYYVEVYVETISVTSKSSSKVLGKDTSMFHDKSAPVTL